MIGVGIGGGDGASGIARETEDVTVGVIPHPEGGVVDSGTSLPLSDSLSISGNVIRSKITTPGLC